MARGSATVGLLVAAVMGPVSAFAACPIELSVYEDRDGVASMNFRPRGDAAAVTNAFRLAFREGFVADGVVMWTQGVERPYGMVMHECPEGDVTGEELAACTLWQGPVYVAGDDGGLGLLPREGEPAPPQIVLADLAYALSVAPAFTAAGLATPPFDIFELRGCQE